MLSLSWEPGTGPFQWESEPVKISLGNWSQRRYTSLEVAGSSVGAVKNPKNGFQDREAGRLRGSQRWSR